MKKIIISLILLSALVLPVMVMAQPVTVPIFPTGGPTTITQVYGAMAKFLWVFFAIIALLAFIIAGVLFLTAGGDPEKIKTARTAFVWGVVGVIVGIIAFSVVPIVGSIWKP